MRPPFHAEADPPGSWESTLSRRDLFSRVSDGLYGAALAYLLGGDLFSPQPARAQAGHRKVYDLQPRAPHFEPKAKAVIQLFMSGGPSQVDLLDPKPLLEKYAGQPPGRDIAKDILFIGNAGGMMPSPFQFARHGESGMEISELLPHLAQQADDIALIRSMFTTNFSHGPATFLMQGGSMFPDRPTVGAWVVYGLGCETQNLPAYVVLIDSMQVLSGGIKNWHSGWLPPVYQGTHLRSQGSPILNLKPPEGLPQSVVELKRSLLGRLDAAHRDGRPGQPDLEARISSYELAARMQISATDALDISQESPETQQMYGLNEEVTASYGRRCLMARRLVERGVRFVQIYASYSWDHHANLEKNLRICCDETDKPVGALLRDLKQRGLLDGTLVTWGGEFGRLPYAQFNPGDKIGGRDHGPAGFTVWMAGGGIQGGTVYGTTDEIGYQAVENPVSVHDFHATTLHQLGMDHRKLVYNHNGLDERLTGVEPARVVKEILA